MKKYKFMVVLFGIVAICLIGCSNEEQYIQVQKRIGEENNYEDFKKITASKKVKKVKKILNDIEWQNAQVNMIHPPDYKFAFQYKAPNVEAKAVLYNLWISPNKNKIELVIDAESKYVQLDTETSAELFQILVGELVSK